MAGVTVVVYARKLGAPDGVKVGDSSRRNVLNPRSEHISSPHTPRAIVGYRGAAALEPWRPPHRSNALLPRERFTGDVRAHPRTTSPTRWASPSPCGQDLAKKGFPHGSAHPRVSPGVSAPKLFPPTLAVRLRGIGTGISEASKRVPIFPFATQGGKQAIPLRSRLLFITAGPM